MQVFPNPNDGNFTINFHLSKMSEIKIIIQDVKGFIENATIKNLKLGKNTYSKKLEGLVNGGVYFAHPKYWYWKSDPKNNSRKLKRWKDTFLSY